MSRWHDRFPWTASVIRFLWPEGPARRKRWLRIATGVLVLVLAHAALTAWMAQRTARVADRFVERFGPLDPAAQRPAPVDDAANKARAVRAAAEVMVRPSDRKGSAAQLVDEFGAGRANRFSPAEREAIRGLVTENAIALSLLDLAIARGGSNWDLHYEWGVEMEVPPLLRIIGLAKLNAAAGRLALEEGRVDEALTAVRRGAAIAASLEGEPVLIVQFVCQAVTRIDLALARRILATAELSAEQAARLSGAVAGANPRRTMQQALIAEAKALDGIVRGEEGRPGSRSTTFGAPSLGILRALARPYLLGEERTWLEVMTRRIDELDAPRHARPDAPEPRLRAWNVLVRIIAPENTSLLERTDLAESRDELARAAIAIERHRAETGRTPSTLAELVPAFLSAVPVDPLTGQGFRYESDGASWRLASAFDWRATASSKLADPLLDWSRGG